MKIYHVFTKCDFPVLIFLIVSLFFATGNFKIFHIDPNCTPPRGDVCILIRQCPYFTKLLNNSPIPRPRHVIKIIKEHQCGFQANTPKVCCFLESRNFTQHFPNFMQLNNVTETKNFKNLELLPRTTCGQISHHFRITGGSTTSLLEFPWMALIAYRTSDGLDFRCGGTVLNDRYVLTAAHCLQNMTFVGVRLGEYDLSTKKDCDYLIGYCAPPVQDFYIENITLHPNYSPKTFENDIALIRLATPANLSHANVKPICLPIDDNLNLDGKFAVVAGWGVTEMGFKTTQLLKTSVPVIPTEDCQKTYENYASITKKHICAGGYLGRDSCGGDSGGPLKYISKVNGVSKYVQYGIVSYGPKHCGADGQPGIYTKVSDYIDWILENLEPSDD